MAISDIVGRTVNDFADYAIAIVTIMLIYYAIKFFMVAPPTKEEREEAERERQKNAQEFREYVGGKYKLHKRRESIRFPKSNIILAIEDCENLIQSLSKKKRKDAVADAKEDLKNLRHHLHLALRYLRRNRRRESGEGYKFFDELYAECGTAVTLTENLALPLPTVVDWDDKIREFTVNVKQIQGVCGVVLGALSNFIDDGTRSEVPGVGGPRSPSGGRGPPLY